MLSCLSSLWWFCLLVTDYIFVCIVATSGSIISALNSLIQFYMNVHHCRCVALWFVNICQKGWFWAASLASGSSMPNEDWSLQTFRIQVEHGLPGRFSPLSGICTNKFQLASVNSFIWATCPNRESRRDLTVEEGWGCWVIRRTASFLTETFQWISKILRRHHWSNASVRCTSASLTIQQSDPYNITGKCKHGAHVILSRLQWSISRLDFA